MKSWLPLAARALVPCLSLAHLALGQPTTPGVWLPSPIPNGVLYVLQHDQDTIRQLSESGAGWKIVEPSTNGLPSGDLTPQQIESMRVRTPGLCRSSVLAYLSIGEAEDYRAYWDPAWVDAQGRPIAGVAPAWLGDENPDWEGNYKVRYWHRAWKNLLWGTPTGPRKTPLDRILDQGFDGVYLDVVDAFEFWSEEEGEISRRVARERMVGLIEQIGQYAQLTRGKSNFRVVIQNGEQIVNDDNGVPDDLRDRLAIAVRGLGLEDVFFDGTKPQPAAYTTEVLTAARAMFETLLFPQELTPIPIFVTDYVIGGRNVNSAANRARAAALYTRAAEAGGLLPYAARSDRDLDEVLTLGGPKWTIVQPQDSCRVCEVCLADLANARGTALTASGTPDGTVDLADYQFFLWAYANNDERADLTSCSIAGGEGYGIPDGRVDFQDMALFLELYSRATGL